MNVQPYLFFDGSCEEALNFYREALGAEVSGVMRFKDAPDQSMVPPGSGDKVMHASFRIGDTHVLATDGRAQGHPSFHGFGLVLNAANEPEARRLFEALADNGKVTMQLAKTFFSPCFGMVTDRFGVQWMVNTAE